MRLKSSVAEYSVGGGNKIYMKNLCFGVVYVVVYDGNGGGLRQVGRTGGEEESASGFDVVLAGGGRAVDSGIIHRDVSGGNYVMPYPNIDLNIVF